MPLCSQKLPPPQHHTGKLLFESIFTLELLNQLNVLALRFLVGSALVNEFLPLVVLVFRLRPSISVSNASFIGKEDHASSRA